MKLHRDRASPIINKRGSPILGRIGTKGKIDSKQPHFSRKVNSRWMNNNRDKTTPYDHKNSKEIGKSKMLRL